MASQDSDQRDIAPEVNSELTYNTLFYASMTSEPIKERLLLLTDNAAAELEQKVLSGPLWRLDHLGEEHLDEEVYKERFTPGNQRRINLATQILHSVLELPADVLLPVATNTLELALEASKASNTVKMKPDELVNMFMDVDHWVAMFPNVISRATTFKKMIGNGETHDALIAMKAEFCFPTPCHITRKSHFVRRSKKLNEHTWLIVDVSFEIPGVRYIRKPSGCLIEQVDDGSSKVTVVEHNEIAIEAEHLPVLFRGQVSSGFAFRASRWISMLTHQTEFQHLMVNQQINGHDGGRSSLLRLAHRMSQIFMRSVNSSTKNPWKAMMGGYNAGQIFERSENFNNHLGRPDGHVISVATSERLPFTSDTLYDSLRCPECHPKWDIAMLGVTANQELRILIGNDPSNYVSVLNLQVDEMDISKRVQACFTDSNSMYIVWTFIETATMNAIMAGGDPDAVGILVCGAAVLPWDPIVDDGGSILTVSFESLEKSEGLVRKDVLYANMTNTISLVNEMCTTTYADHAGHDEDD